MSNITNIIGSLPPEVIAEIRNTVSREYTSWDYYLIAGIVLSILGTILVGVKLVLNARKAEDENTIKLFNTLIKPLEKRVEIIEHDQDKKEARFEKLFEEIVTIGNKVSNTEGMVKEHVRKDK